jgi:hypothetical protein
VEEPSVVCWYRVTLGAMAAIYLGCVVLGGVLVRFHREIAAHEPEDEPRVIRFGGVLCIALGILLLAAYVAGFFLPRKPRAWIAHLVLIAIGLTSCCTLPASIPLLVFWLKPEVQAWVGRRVTV